MENMIITSLSTDQIRKMFRDEIENFFSSRESNPDDKMLTIEQASEFLKLKTATIYTLHSRGEIPAHKRGKRLFFSTRDLNRWLKKPTSSDNVEK